jgi:membrane protease YdiL (CAAX protease family)
MEATSIVMISRLFVTADRRIALGWRITVAVIAWFAMLILTEELIANVAGQAVGGAAVIGASVVTTVFLRHKLDRRPTTGARETLADLGLTGHRAVRLLATGFCLGALAMSVVLAFAVTTHAVHLEGWNPHRLGLAFTIWLAFGNLVFFLGVGFTEELLFRGYILRNLGERIPLWGALTVSSALFGLFHGLHASVADLAEIMLGGFMLGLLRLAAGTLWLPIGLHAAWDFIENGIVTTRLLPARGPMLEQTAAGWFMPILIIAAVLLITRRRGQRLNWRGKTGEQSELLAPEAAVGM